MKTINIKLPLFHGFYGSSLFDLDINENPEEYGGISPSEYDKICWPSTFIEASKLIVDEFNGTFVDLLKQIGIESLTFESLFSPREYNFRNDEIYVDVSGDFEKFRSTVYDTITGEYQNKVIEYLEGKFKSRSGFQSFYPYKLSEWVEILQGHHDEYNLNDGVVFSTFLDIIVQLEYYYDLDVDLEFDYFDQIYEKEYDLLQLND